MKYITVLDFEDGKVYQYDIDGLGFNPDTFHESCEGYLIGKGHNLNNIQWMTSNNNEIIKDQIKIPLNRVSQQVEWLM